LSNPITLTHYSISLDYRIINGSRAGIVFAARNKDSYVLAEADHESLLLSFYDVQGGVRNLLGKFGLNDVFAENHIEIYIDATMVTVIHNEAKIAENADILTKTQYFEIPKNSLMLIGFYQMNNRVEYKNITVAEDKPYILPVGVLKPLGEVGNGSVIVENSFELTSVVMCPVLKRSFIVDNGLKSATLYASARGFYNAYVNGDRIGDMYFAPGFTDYRLRIMYQEYDITGNIHTGENEIKAYVGNGYYSGCAGYNVKANVYGTENSFIGKLRLEYENGKCEEIVTDESWEMAVCSPIMFADYLQGEYYDARMEAAVYEKCEIMPKPTIPKPTNGEIDGLRFTLERQVTKGAHEVMRLSPQFVGKSENGGLIYDFGQNMVGTVKLCLKGKRGLGIKIRYGEMLRKNGELYTANLRSAANIDVYILKGGETESFCFDLTAHGFRYAEISANGGDLDEVEILDIVGIVISDIDRQTGSFECSNELINKLYSNILWGQRGNFLLVPTDCPQRNERMGWTGDAQVFVRTAAYNMDVYDFMRKWLKDVREAQLMYNRGGAVPDIAPLCGDNRGGCAGWADAAVIVPWELYMAYGKREILEENYEMMKAWVDWSASNTSKPYIIKQPSRGDHLSFDKSTPYILSGTAYAAYVAELMGKIAKELGFEEDTIKYEQLHNNIKQAFRKEWVKEDGTLAYYGEMSNPDVNKIYYSDDEDSENHPSQTAYALAIDFGLIEINERVKKCFKRTIDVRGGKLSVGFLGIEHLMPALMKCGFTEEAFALLEQTENPGWLYSVINGATTIWERWDSYVAETDTFGDVSMNSFNHYAYGAVGEWLFGSLLGIKPLKPGYGEIIIEPHCGGKITYAKGSFISPHGEIFVAWEKQNDEYVFDIKIPEGIKAEIKLPKGGSLR
jgi:alpha-L-rhamnosidase